jgi:hypothetical protein
MRDMPVYPLDFCKTIEALARARLVHALCFSEPSEVGTSGSGFTVAQFQEAAALYRRRAVQTPVLREQREYQQLARRFAEEAENGRINGLAPMPEKRIDHVHT